MGLIEGAASAALTAAAPEVALPLKALGFARKHLGLILGGVGILILGIWLAAAKAELRSDAKRLDQDAKWETLVRHEVDQGVCGGVDPKTGKHPCVAVDPSAVPEQVRAAFERDAVTQEQLATANAEALRADEAAKASKTASHAAAGGTEQQQQLQGIQRSLGSPARSTGVSSEEWNGL